MTHAKHTLTILVSCCVAAAGASRPEQTARSSNVTRGCVERFDANADYFPDKTTIQDATGFSVEYRRTYKIVALKGGQPGDRPEKHLLVQCGTPPPALTGDLAGADIIQVPISSLFAFSTTQLSPLADLERIDVLTGVAQRDAITDPTITARIREGRIVEFARVGLVIDVERVVASHPALLMAGSTSNRAVPSIRSAGIPVVANAEWLEQTALGRAEWLKFMALFLNEERKADSVYGAVKARYRASKTKANGSASRPLVMTGRSSRGLFTVAGGRGYVAHLIADAGGRYVWDDNTSTGIFTVDIEAQTQRAANADFWINGGGWKSLTAMLEDEPRYSAFKAYRNGQVWVYERRQTPTGANDYWARSVTRPDLVLADLLKILHPDRAVDHTFEWYMRVPGQ